MSFSFKFNSSYNGEKLLQEAHYQKSSSKRSENLPRALSQRCLRLPHEPLDRSLRLVSHTPLHPEGAGADVADVRRRRPGRRWYRYGRPGSIVPFTYNSWRLARLCLGRRPGSASDASRGRRRPWLWAEVGGGGYSLMRRPFIVSYII